MATNCFLLPIEEYTRHLDPLGDWLKQSAWYVSRVKDLPYEHCVNQIKEKIKNKQIRFNNPTVVFNYREENGDSHRRTAALMTYIKRAINENNIVAATGTCYLHPSVKESHVVGYLTNNVKLRSKFKKLAQKYEFEALRLQQEGLSDEAAAAKLLQSFNHKAQDNAKRSNNSVSGGFVSEGNPLHNKSAHSTLTSTTASIASLSNASNERIVSGNRYYASPKLIQNNLISICSNSDYKAIQAAIDTFGLQYPTTDDVMECIQYSSDLYFRDRRKLQAIRTTLVEKLTPLERAAFVYTGDLYHLRKINPEFLRDFITQLSSKGQVGYIENPRKAIFSFDEQVINFAHQINIKMMAGLGKDYDKLSDADAAQLYWTCHNVQTTIEKYAVFIRAFLLTQNHPCAVSSIQHMVRRSVVLSDTDSTMFSVDEWVQWYFGKIHFSEEAYGVAGSVTYIATQSIAHILACFSANMNVAREHIHTLAMKPEFVFPVFAQTSVAKHYFTAKIMKEGNVYRKLDMEIKGVHMKDSTVPDHITDASAEEMRHIIDTVMAGEQVSLERVLRKTIETEEEIFASIRRGEMTYLKRSQIKNRASYKQGVTPLKPGEVDKTPYRQYNLWVDVFQEKYGPPPVVPYQAVSIPLNLPNKTALQKWLNSLPDQGFAQRFAKWMNDYEIKKITQLQLPQEICANIGIPEELHPALNSKRIALTLTKSYRHVAESLGFFSKPDLLFYEQICLHPAVTV